MQIWLRRTLYMLPVIVALVIFLAIQHATAPPLHKTTRQVTAKPQVPPPEPAFADGSRKLVPEHRLVALYGTPSMSVLGALGEQPLEQTITRVKDVAAQYQVISREPILPTLEIITTVASASPTENGDYSQEIPIDTLWPWITAAREAGVYVVLDLQPGRTDFLTQAKQYEPLLRQPHVGLALDPEWRLTPTQVHLTQIGSVSINEVNAVADWLASLAHEAHSPQKAFLLHQFRLSMIPDRQLLHAAHPELSYIVQMDGQGAQPVKQDTWRAIGASLPGQTYLGWKNFFDEDKPMLTPQETMNIVPVPWYISYQ